MEVIAKNSFKEKMNNLFLKEKEFLINRREINWSLLGKCALGALIVGIIGILIIPAQKEAPGTFHERADLNSTENQMQPTSDPTTETIKQMSAGGFSRKVPGTLDHLYASSSVSGTSSGDERNSSMVIARGGLDAKTQIPPGSRIAVKLYEKAVVANQAMPVIGLVTRDYVHEDTLAIPQGSKLFGSASYDDSGDRAKIDWQSVQFPDGRERQLSAIGVSSDGQIGVIGSTRSEAIKNSVGQAMTRFLGAYAEGSMQKGALGGSPGGNDNGWKNAIAETAKDRADAWADDLKKEKRWIEVSNSTEFYAVLTAAFAFRDPGATYGR